MLAGKFFELYEKNAAVASRGKQLHVESMACFIRKPLCLKVIRKAANALVKSFLKVKITRIYVGRTKHAENSTTSLFVNPFNACPFASENKELHAICSSIEPGKGTGSEIFGFSSR